MRILVTGSRDWPYPEAIDEYLSEHLFSDLVVVHGGCPKGADKMASDWAKRHGVREEIHPANWDLHGKKAGFVRNAEMVALGARLCLAFIKDGSRGASMTANLAEKAGISTRRITC